MRTSRAEAILFRLIFGTLFFAALVVVAGVLHGLIHVGVPRVLLGVGLALLALGVTYVAGSIIFAMLTRHDR